MMLLLTYLVLGAGAGLLAGLFGIGGGLVIVPVLIFAFTWLQFAPETLVHLAVGTSLATIIPTSISSAWSHHKRQGVDWSWVVFLTPGLMVGALLGAYTASLLSGLALQKVIGTFVLLVSVQMALQMKPKPAAQVLARPWRIFAGGVIGWASAIFGIGGGTLSVPFLTWCRLAMHRAVGTAAALGLPIALFGAAGSLLAGWGRPDLPDWASGFVYWPAAAAIVVTSVPFARLGTRLAYFLPERRLKLLFALLLLLVGLRFLFGS